MTRRTALPMLVITLAVIAGWMWRIVYEQFPAWQPVAQLAGLVTITGLAEWLFRSVDRRQP